MEILSIFAKKTDSKWLKLKKLPEMTKSQNNLENNDQVI